MKDFTSLFSDGPTRRMIFILCGAVFASELLVMWLLSTLSAFPFWSRTLLDSILLLIPILLVFRLLPFQIAERKRAESAIERSEAELSAIYEHAPFMMCLINERREVERMNRAMTELVGGARPGDGFWRPGDILGCLNALDDPDGCGAGPECRLCPLRLAIIETLETGRPKTRVEAHLHLARNGVRREIRLSGSTASVKVGGETKLLLCVEDITTQRQLEQQFLQAQKMEAVGQLAGGVAHDFNNILTAIMLHLHSLLRTAGLGPTIAASLKELGADAERGTHLIRQLLTFSRRQAMQRQWLDFNAILNGMVKMLGRLLGEHIEINVTCAPESPRVEADAGMIEQVIMNLCVNARDAMPKGGRLVLQTAVVDIGADEARQHADARVGRFVCLTVRDNGCGMDDATLKRIFEPFFTTKEAGRGTGLGLATVYGIIKRHDGWLAVQSAVGAGTAFSVYLPLAAAAENPGRLKHGTGTILLVEDNTSLLKHVSHLLRGCGYRVHEVRNGAEAMQVWERTGREVDLLLTDLVMPGGASGIELAESLQRAKPSLKLVMTSGHSDELVLRGGKTVPGAKFLPKPYEPALLAQTVSDCMEGEN